MSFLHSMRYTCTILSCTAEFGWERVLKDLSNTLEFYCVGKNTSRVEGVLNREVLDDSESISTNLCSILASQV